MKRTCCLLLLLGLAAVVHAADRPRDPIPAGTDWAISLDIRPIREIAAGLRREPVVTPLTNIKSDGADDGDFWRTFAAEFVKELKKQPEFGPKLAEFQQAFGIHPFRDIEAVTAFGVIDADEKVVVYARGTFDVERIEKTAALAPGHTVAAYGERRVHSWVDGKKKAGAGAFANPNLLVVGGSVAAIQQALDTIDGKNPAMTPIPASTKSECILWGSITDLGAAKRDPNSAMLQEMKSIFASVNLTPAALSASLTAEARNDAAAQNVKNVVEGLRALAALNAKDDPKAAEFARRLLIVSQGHTITISIDIPMEAVQKQLNEIKDGVRDGIKAREDANTLNAKPTGQ